MYLHASIKPKLAALPAYHRRATRRSSRPARLARAYNHAAASRKNRKNVSSFAVRLTPVALTSSAQSTLAHAAIRMSGKSSRHSRNITSVVSTPPTNALGNRTAASSEISRPCVVVRSAPFQAAAASTEAKAASFANIGCSALAEKSRCRYACTALTMSISSSANPVAPSAQQREKAARVTAASSTRRTVRGTVTLLDILYHAFKTNGARVIRSRSVPPRRARRDVVAAVFISVHERPSVSSDDVSLARFAVALALLWTKQGQPAMNRPTLLVLAALMFTGCRARPVPVADPLEVRARHGVAELT